jgi:hypothetical protein
MISKPYLGELPDLSGFERLTRALAALDATMSPEWQYRYYSFDPEWSDGETMASMRNGSGDHWFAVLCPAGIALHGLSHESPQFRPGQPQPWIFDRLPSEFHECLLHEQAFDTANSTFCVWRLVSDSQWKCGDVGSGSGDDGSADLLAILAGDPRKYVEFASDHFERKLDPATVQAVYQREAMTPELASRLNPDVNFQVLRGELRKLGYPLAG